MALSALILVLASAALHAWWNLVLKQNDGDATVLGLSKLLEVALLGPLLWPLAATPLDVLLRHWPLPVGGAVLVTLNYAALARAYRGAGDLGLVYAVSRGAMVVFVPVLAWCLTARTPTIGALVGVITIVGGIVLLHMDGIGWTALATFMRGMRHRASYLAMTAGVVAAGYTLWDQHAVRQLSPVTYFFSYSAGVAAVMAWPIVRRTRRDVAAVVRAAGGPLPRSRPATPAATC